MQYLFNGADPNMRVQVVKNIEQEFLEPSFNYLVQNGLENTSVRDLCKAMGISSGSIYYWFEDKDDIYISTVKYGIKKVAGKLFDALFEKADNIESFFNTFLDEVDKYKLEFRLIFQVTTSPVYGDRMRETAEDFKNVYAKYILHFSEITGHTVEIITNVIYMLIALLVDYIIWEDRPTSEMQLKFINKILSHKDN